MPRRGHRAPAADGTIASCTPAQYRILRYWAGNTADRPERGADPRPYPDRAGLPIPRIQRPTADMLTARRWWIMTLRGWVVTDAGRQACGAAPARRDRPCPVRGCYARTGERCRTPTLTGWRYSDLAHTARYAAPAPAPAVPRPPDILATAGFTPPGILAVFDEHLPDLAVRLRSPIEPRHVGWVCAT